MGRQPRESGDATMARCGPHVVSGRRRVRGRERCGGQVDDERGAIAFGQRLLALLDTGSFTTSYKYALLLAIP